MVVHIKDIIIILVENADGKSGLGFYQEHFHEALRSAAASGGNANTQQGGDGGGGAGDSSLPSNPTSLATMVTSSDYTSGGMTIPTPSTPLSGKYIRDYRDCKYADFLKGYRPRAGGQPLLLFSAYFVLDQSY